MAEYKLEQFRNFGHNNLTFNTISAGGKLQMQQAIIWEKVDGWLRDKVLPYQQYFCRPTFSRPIINHANALIPITKLYKISIQGSHYSKCVPISDYEMNDKNFSLQEKYVEIVQRTSTSIRRDKIFNLGNKNSNPKHGIWKSQKKSHSTLRDSLSNFQTLWPSIFWILMWKCWVIWWWWW